MDEKDTVLVNMHKLLLEALRHREQEIFRYLAIIGPAIGGFIWLIRSNTSSKAFVVGTLSVLFLLLLEAVYSLALGYNYRYITLQIAKLEKVFEIENYMLKGWPRSPDVFLKRNRNKLLFGIPWCSPPEIIWVFWWAFLIGIVGVMTSACLVKPSVPMLAMVIPVGLVCVVVGGFLFPLYYGWKLHKQCKQEPRDWDLDQSKGNVKGGAKTGAQGE